MKPHHYFLVIAGFSGIAIALYYLSFGRQVDPSPAYTALATTSPVDSRPAPVAMSPVSPLNKEVPTAASSPENNPFAEIKRRLDEPRQREANLLRAKLNIERTYGRLFQRLRHQPPEVLDRLKTALAEKQLAMERGSLPDHLPVSEAEAKAGKEKLDRIQAEAGDQIQAILGDEVYAQYNYFQQSEPYRGSIEQVTSMMRSRGVDVSDDMQEKILAGYTSALVAAAKVSANDMTPEAFQALSDPARRELRVKQQSRFDEILASKMSKLLSPTDYKLFMDSEFVQDASSP